MRTNALGHGRLWDTGLPLLAVVLALAVNTILTAPPSSRQSSTPAQRGSPFPVASSQQQYPAIKQQQQQQGPLARRPQAQQAPAPGSGISLRGPNVQAPSPDAHPRWFKPSTGLNLANKPNELRGGSGGGGGGPRVAATRPTQDELVYDESLDDVDAPYAYEEEVAPLAPEEELTTGPHGANGKTSVNEAYSLARNLMNGLHGNGQAKSAGLNFKNQQTTIKVGNNKKVNVNHISNHVAPTISNSRFDRLELGGQPSLVVPNNYAQINLSPGESHKSLSNNPDSKGEELKTKATDEQKELKKKLLELADKATSSHAVEDADLLKFNSETGQFEPATVDPKATEYKQKLQDAIKALSAKKLPTERLKEALEGFDVDSSDAPEALNFQSDNPEQSNHPPQFGPNPSAPDEDDGEIEIEPPAHEDEEFSSAEDEFVDEQLPMYEREEGEELPPPEEAEPEHAPDEEEPEHAPEEEEPEHAAEEEPEVDPLTQVREILADRLNRISDLLYFRPEFLNQLLQIDDNLLTPIEAEFKRMILCNSDEQFCQDDLSKYVNPDGLLPAPLTDEELAMPMPPTEEELSTPEEEEEPEFEAEQDDGGEIDITMGQPSPYTQQLPIAPPAGAKHFSHSKSSVNFQYDHAQTNAHFGDEAAPPVVQHGAVANPRSWINGKHEHPMEVRGSGPAPASRPSVRHQASAPFSVAPTRTAVSPNRRLVRRPFLPPNELQRRTEVAPKPTGALRPSVRSNGPVHSPASSLGQAASSQSQANVGPMRRDAPQPASHYQQANAPSFRQARPVSPLSVQRQQQQPLVRHEAAQARPQAPPAATSGYAQVTPIRPAGAAVGQQPAMQAVAPVSGGRRFGDTRPIGK